MRTIPCVNRTKITQSGFPLVAASYDCFIAKDKKLILFCL